MKFHALEASQEDMATVPPVESPLPFNSMATSRPLIPGRLFRLIAGTRLIMTWERLWPTLALPLYGLALFVTLSWLDLWSLLPPAGHLCFIGLAALCGGACFIPLLRLIGSGRLFPTPGEAVRKLDETSHSAHQPATTLFDSLALKGNTLTDRVWQAHRSRALKAVERLTLPVPSPQLQKKDPCAFRALILVSLAGSAFVAGPERGARLSSAFQWNALANTEAGVRLDAWIDPPAYTHRPPLVVALTSTETPLQFSVPVGSVLTLHAGGKNARDAVTAALGSGLEALPSVGQAQDAQDMRIGVNASSDVTVTPRSGSPVHMLFEAIPDRPPSITLTQVPSPTARGTLRISYQAHDDYGVASVEVRTQPLGLSPLAQPLVPPPRAHLDTPTEKEAARSAVNAVLDLTEHPWAGASVRLTLVARDEAGGEGQSKTVSLVLPQRKFANPWAKALIDARLQLALDGGSRPLVQAMLESLIERPSVQTLSAGAYLGISSVTSRLRFASADAELAEVVAALWDVAILIEDGGLAKARQDLQTSEAALRDALKRGASDAEIRKLVDSVRDAIEQAMRTADGQATHPSADAKTVTPDDFKKLLDRLEQASISGNTAEAEAILKTLKDVLAGLRSGQPRNAASQVRHHQRKQALDEIDRMLRTQTDVRDETFRNEGQPQPGASSESKLTERQRSLRQQLDALQQRLQNNGEPGDQSLNEANQAMTQAEKALQGEEKDQALEAQGQALESLQKSGQSLAKRMTESEAQEGNGAEEDDDPLGRSSSGRGLSNSGVSVPEGGETGASEARRILEEMRRRVGDQNRPKPEIDYLERLLRVR